MYVNSWFRDLTCWRLVFSLGCTCKWSNRNIFKNEIIILFRGGMCVYVGVCVFSPRLLHWIIRKIPARIPWACLMDTFTVVSRLWGRSSLCTLGPKLYGKVNLHNTSYCPVEGCVGFSCNSPGVTHNHVESTPILSSNIRGWDPIWCGRWVSCDVIVTWRASPCIVFTKN